MEAPGERRVWKGVKPCYFKSRLVGAVAVAIDSKVFSEDRLSMDAKLEWLHSVHLSLDEVAIKFKAEKFSGSGGSYLITKACETEREAAIAVCQIGEEILKVNPKVGDSVEVQGCFGTTSGYDVLIFVCCSCWLRRGFYGECIETLKSLARTEGSIGELYKTARICNILEENNEEPSSSHGQQVNEGQESPEVFPYTYEEWWGRDSQLIELGIIVVTLLLSLVGISGAWQKTDESMVHTTLFLVLQLNCFVCGVFVLYIWFIDHEQFVKKQSFYMVIVWACQFLNRIIGSLFMPLASDKLFDLHFLLRLFAANGPTKFLLTTAPLVSWQWSTGLHICGTVSAILFSFRICSSRLNKGDMPFDCTDGGRLVVIMLNVVFLCFLPIYYAYHCNQTSSKEYKMIKGQKQQ